jgi:hypothetical protein
MYQYKTDELFNRLPEEIQIRLNKIFDSFSTKSVFGKSKGK